MAVAEQNEWQKVQERQKQRVLKYQSLEAQYKERRHHLQRLKQMLEYHEEEWLEALREDLGKPPVEGYTSEIALLLNEIDYALQHLKEWMIPAASKRLLLGAVEKTSVQQVPHGSVLIVSPWNYPLQLALMPLVGALAAGNSCFIKPSEYAEATSRLLSHLVGRYFPLEVVMVAEGDATVSQQLVELDWDFIFFTGSKRVGKIVHQQAAERTIPVALELGGKNPCIIDETGLTKEHVRRILWGKYLNAGQSCIAPDTVYVHESVLPEFLTLAQKIIREFYGPNSQLSKDYGRIISTDHFDRLTGYLTEGHIYAGGRCSREERFLEPTLLLNPSEKVQQEEIFGPILPIIPYKELTVLLDSLNDRPAPLVTYFFSKNKEASQYVKSQMKSGAVSLNQVIRHAANARIPFGGVGASGFGRYHGKTSFDTFSYQKVSYTQSSWMDSSVQYPPYKNKHIKWLRRLRKRLF